MQKLNARCHPRPRGRRQTAGHIRFTVAPQRPVYGGPNFAKQITHVAMQILQNWQIAFGHLKHHGLFLRMDLR